SDVLAWVSAGGSQIDTVTTPRQPGSTLKPLLYALALEHGWSAATLVEDSPLEQPIGVGLHTYRNYSGQHYGPLRVREALGNSQEVSAAAPGRRVYSAAVSALIADILADPEARRLEFRRANLLRFPVETAVKTGTSSDYRDAWAVGFSHHYTAGVWMGNLQQRPMQDVTGSLGPALVLRALFAELHRDIDTQPLTRSSQLTPVTIC